MTRAAFLLLPLLLSTPAHAAPLTAADRAWIARCVDQLAREDGSRQSKQRYCACMHENFEDNEQVTQSEMERLYPPLHRACRAEAGRPRR